MAEKDFYSDFLPSLFSRRRVESFPTMPPKSPDLRTRTVSSPWTQEQGTEIIQRTLDMLGLDDSPDLSLVFIANPAKQRRPPSFPLSMDW
jgi:hypothetical protein